MTTRSIPRDVVVPAAIVTTMSVVAALGFRGVFTDWSFVRDGLSGVRLGGTSYAGYHNENDVPSVINPAQLERTARTVLAWLR